MQGFECCFTKSTQAITYLVTKGAQPVRPVAKPAAAAAVPPAINWDQSPAGGHPAAPAAQ
jgi:hypothetical protein